MKARMWKHKHLPIRVIERNKFGEAKEGLESTYDIQVRKHHIWCNSATKLTKEAAEGIIGIKLG